MKPKRRTNKAAPPSPNVTSFPATAFGRDTLPYRAFLQALLDGQRAYDQMQRGTSHAQTSLSAA